MGNNMETWKKLAVTYRMTEKILWLEHVKQNREGKGLMVESQILMKKTSPLRSSKASMYIVLSLDSLNYSERLVLLLQGEGNLRLESKVSWQNWLWGALRNPGIGQGGS